MLCVDAPFCNLSAAINQQDFYLTVLEYIFTKLYYNIRFENLQSSLNLTESFQSPLPTFCFVLYKLSSKQMSLYFVVRCASSMRDVYDLVCYGFPHAVSVGCYSLYNAE